MRYPAATPTHTSVGSLSMQHWRFNIVLRCREECASCSHLRQGIPGLDSELQLLAVDSATQRCRQTTLC